MPCHAGGRIGLGRSKSTRLRFRRPGPRSKPAHLAQLTRRLGSLAPAERITLPSDGFALAQARELPMDAYVDLLAADRFQRLLAGPRTADSEEDQQTRGS